MFACAACDAPRACAASCARRAWLLPISSSRSSSSAARASIARSRRSPASGTSRPTWPPRSPPRRSRAASAGCCSSACPTDKDEQGSSAWDDAGPVQSAIRAIRAQAPGLPVLTDVCLCQYTSHGACGVLHDGEVDNDATLPLLARVALSHARAGADAVAPSDMMDGRVAAIRSGARRRRLRERSRSSPTARSSPRPSTGRSGTRRARRPSPATARATSSTARTRARPCARPCSTRPRAPTR